MTLRDGERSILVDLFPSGKVSETDWINVKADTEYIISVKLFRRNRVRARGPDSSVCKKSWLAIYRSRVRASLPAGCFFWYGPLISSC